MGAARDRGLTRYDEDFMLFGQEEEVLAGQPYSG